MIFFMIHKISYHKVRVCCFSQKKIPNKKFSQQKCFVFRTNFPSLPRVTKCPSNPIGRQSCYFASKPGWAAARACSTRKNRGKRGFSGRLTVCMDSGWELRAASCRAPREVWKLAGGGGSFLMVCYSIRAQTELSRGQSRLYLEN